MSYEHGMSGSPEYKCWERMKYKCRHPAHQDWYLYGGRGITVCKRWEEDFLAFYEDMGPRPSSKHSIDRIDNDGNYEPGNCRWATMTEQGRNRRISVYLTVRGVTKHCAEWAEASPARRLAIMDRIRIRGWSVEDAVFSPPKAKGEWTEDDAARIIAHLDAGREG